MPVSTGTGSHGEPAAKRCKLCEDSSHKGGHQQQQQSPAADHPSPAVWQLQLDRDLVDTISAIYPEWFAAAAGGGAGVMDGGGGGAAAAPPGAAAGGGPPPLAQLRGHESPPKAIVDTSPIRIDQNKESLKVKLLLRRPFDQLVAQGIMPPQKTPAAYHGQRRQLERAKTGDVLKAKIQQRPPRHELERRHILEADTGHTDPSLAERRRMLKKARLADQLNDQLSHRPGPLELIQKNILHTEETIEQAVKTGRIPYKATSEGQLNRPQHPHNYINPEEDSQSSEGDNASSSPPPVVTPGSSDVLEAAAKQAGIVVSLVGSQDGSNEVLLADLCRSVAAPILGQAARSASSPASLASSTSTLSPLSSVASPVASQPPTPAPIPPPPPPPMTLVTRTIPSPIAKSDAPGKDKNRKKSKSKSAPKARTIKFHEYKGPPSAQKSSAGGGNAGESSYDLLLKQQTLLLQFQLQLQHKYPQIILPASNKQQAVVPEAPNPNLNVQQASPAPSTCSESSVPGRLTCRLEDMKVSDLKAELKRRSLPVSGSKPQLIERLKPFTSDTVNQNPASVESGSATMDQLANSPGYGQDVGSPRTVKVEDERMEVGEPPSPQPRDGQAQGLEVFKTEVVTAEKSKEDIVKEQQRQIEELQRELALSQLKLQVAARQEPKAQVLALQKHLQARQQAQQQQNIALQMRQLQEQARQAQVNEEQQRLQQQQHVAFQNQKNLSGLVLNPSDAAIVFNHLIQGKAKLVNGHSRTGSLPSFLSTIVTPIITPPDAKTEFEKAPHEIKIEFAPPDDPKPPPLYEEATKQLDNNNKKNHVKSQIVDDVLDILIKNGELPPSAANDPSTPGSANSAKNAEPVYPAAQPNANNNEETAPMPPTADDDLGLDPNELLESLDNLDGVDFSQLVMELGGCAPHNDNNNAQGQAPTLAPPPVVPMETDDWLDSLINSENFNGNSRGGEPDLGYDPLLGMQDPFDPFNLDEFRSPADLTAGLSWDKVDYAT